MIFDAGTGIRSLGKEIAARPQLPRAIHIFFTHFHWDHLQGLPYFMPLYMAGSNLIFYSAHPPEKLRQVLAGQMHSPYFPVLFEHLGCRMEFRQVAGEPQSFGGLCVETFPLHHPQGSVGYSIVNHSKKAVYATDHEHSDPETHIGLLQRAQDADVPHLRLAVPSHGVREPPWLGPQHMARRHTHREQRRSPRSSSSSTTIRSAMTKPSAASRMTPGSSSLRP